MILNDDLIVRIAREHQLHPSQVQRTIALLDDGNTVPFITRYRKEATGGLDEEQIRRLADRLAYLRSLEVRRAEIRAALLAGGHLTDPRAIALAAAETLQALEDIYLPFRPKRRTRAQAARELGLQGLADLLLDRAVIDRSPADVTAPFVGEDLDHAAALDGARDIVAETVAETPRVRQALREAVRRSAMLSVQRRDDAVDERGVYQAYYAFTQSLTALPPHRVLAINRGEREGVLGVTFETNHDAFVATLQRRYAPGDTWVDNELRRAISDGYRRLLFPAIERDLRGELTDRAEQHALRMFAANVRRLLLQPPLRGRIVLGIDPGYRTGCKLAVVDPTGKHLAGGVLYLHQPDRARADLIDLCRQHGVQVIAIGNGTASRETEALVAEVIQAADLLLEYTIVSEAGASVYSASPEARNEFPHLDATERGTISIARRLQDPLAELVKIDPQALGVGLYQHDVDQRALGVRLRDVVESVVNFVGVDLNTSSAELLNYVAGLNSKTARSIVEYRDTHGSFTSRRALLKVKGLGPRAFEQAAGFLRIVDAADPLDRTAIHPESYPAARRLIDRFDLDQTQALPDIAARVRSTVGATESGLSDLAASLELGLPTLIDIIEYLARPGRDPRDSLPPPMLRADVLKLDDLEPGMWLHGTVRNVVDFGAFVDIGVKQDGLIHISEMADRFIRDPLEVVQLGDIVTVRILSIDRLRERIALSLRGEHDPLADSRREE
jgi:uncharacterized protein